MDILRSKTVAGIEKELWMFLIVYNLVRLAFEMSASPSEARVPPTLDGEPTAAWDSHGKSGEPCQIDSPGGNGRAAGLGGPFTATVPPLYFSAQTDPASVLARGGANWVKGGATWFISGEVKNESAYKDLCVAPLMPSFTGNAAGVGPHARWPGR